MGHKIEPCDSRMVKTEFIEQKLDEFTKDLEKSGEGYTLTGSYITIAFVLADYQDEDGHIIGNFTGMASEVYQMPGFIRDFLGKVRETVNDMWAELGSLLGMTKMLRGYVEDRDSSEEDEEETFEKDYF